MDKDKDDFKIVQNFGEKLLKEQKEVPEDIQEIINDHFFEML
jgi:hypothetical protein